MAYRLEVSHTAHRQIRRLPAQTQERVHQVTARLAENPRPLGAKKLTARDGYWVRVGDYRILYQVDDGAKLVIIYMIAVATDGKRSPAPCQSLIRWSPSNTRSVLLVIAAIMDSWRLRW